MIGALVPKKVDGARDRPERCRHPAQREPGPQHFHEAIWQRRNEIGASGYRGRCRERGHHDRNFTRHAQLGIAQSERTASPALRDLDLDVPQCMELGLGDTFADGRMTGPCDQRQMLFVQWPSMNTGALLAGPYGNVDLLAR